MEQRKKMSGERGPYSNVTNSFRTPRKCDPGISNEVFPTALDRGGSKRFAGFLSSTPIQVDKPLRCFHEQRVGFRINAEDQFIHQRYHHLLLTAQYG